MYSNSHLRVVNDPAETVELLLLEAIEFGFSGTDSSGTAHIFHLIVI
jgi:hypothetical protein